MKTYTGEPYLLLSNQELNTVKDFVYDIARGESSYNKLCKITFEQAQEQIKAMINDNWVLPYGLDADLFKHFWNLYIELRGNDN